jgi:hypothetical protein
MPSSRAEWRRYAASLVINIFEPLNERRLMGRTKHVSRIGCHMLTADTLEVGTVVELQIERDAISFHTRACVARVRPGFGMDLEFLETDLAQAEVLGEWLEQIANEC